MYVVHIILWAYASTCVHGQLLGPGKFHLLVALHNNMVIDYAFLLRNYGAAGLAISLPLDTTRVSSENSETLCCAPTATLVLSP